MNLTNEFYISVFSENGQVSVFFNNKEIGRLYTRSLDEHWACLESDFYLGDNMSEKTRDLIVTKPKSLLKLFFDEKGITEGQYSFLGLT